MIFKAAKCPNCAGELQVPEGKVKIKCMYCGSDILVQEAIRAAGVNVPNLLELAKIAHSAGNNQEAYDYYTKILEVETQNFEAWFGKGEAAGWMSTLRDFRLMEMVTAIEKAIEYSPEDKKEEIKKKAGDTLNTISMAYFSIAKKNFEEFVSILDEHQNYIDRCCKIKDALIYARVYCPKDKQILENIIEVIRDSAEDKIIPSSDGFREYLRYTTQEYKDATKELIAIIANDIKEIDPSYNYVPPHIKNKSDTRCFIATATLGNFDHPYVVLLRKFRDTWLLERKNGKIVVKYYYMFSPHIANHIGRSKIIRFLCYFVIIRPFARLVCVLMKRGLNG